MPDVQWSSESLPPPKPGLSTGAKVAIGCGLLLLAAGGACAALVVGGAAKVTSAVENFGGTEWTTAKKLTDQLATDEGTHAAWAAYPGLAHSFVSEDEFVRQAALMRPLLEPLPAERPSLLGGRLTMSSNQNNGQTHFEMGYRTLGGSMLLFTFENDQIVNLRLERTVQGPTVVFGPDAG